MRRRQGLLVVLAATAACAGAPAPGPDPAPAGDAAPAAAAPATGVPAEQLQRVRELLRRLHREHLSSRVRFGEGRDDATSALRAAGAGDALLQLLRQRDAVVAELGGTFLAILSRDLGVAARVAPVLCDQLRDGDPRTAAFACEALGCLSWRDAAVHLEPLLRDDRPVPGYGEATVATFAALALKQLEPGSAR